MTAEIISIGTEILLGNIVDTNSAYISQKLSFLGINLYYHTSVGDNKERLVNTIKNSAKRSDLIILTGGLGPTYDDITKECVAEVFKKKLYIDNETLDIIKLYYEKNNRVMTDNNIKQAEIIEGTTILKNDNGLAPGMYFESTIYEKNTMVAILPGPPGEMSCMFDNYLFPILKEKSNVTFHSKTVKIFGVGESKVESDLKEIMEKSLNPTIAPYAKEGEVELRLTSSAKNQNEADQKIIPYIEKIKSIYGKNAYAVDMPNLESVLLEKLRQLKLKISFAESCTGGLLAKRLTDLSGASDVIGFSAVTYSPESKINVLNVSIDTLNNYGVISKECSIEMARGIKRLSGSDIGVSVTGVAGPNQSEGKPVGLVYISVYMNESNNFTFELNLSRGRVRTRDYIRNLAASNALFETINALNIWYN